MKKFLLFAGALLAFVTAQAEELTEKIVLVDNPSAMMPNGKFKEMKEPGELTQGDVTLKWGAIYDEGSWLFKTGDLTVECKDNETLKSITFNFQDFGYGNPSGDFTTVADPSNTDTYGTVVSSGTWATSGSTKAVWTPSEDCSSVTFSLYDVQVRINSIDVTFEVGETNGVAAIEAEQNDVWYDLHGNRVAADRFGKGIYVSANGKKVVM